MTTTRKTIAILALALVATGLDGAPRGANVLAGEAPADIERLDQEGVRALAQIYEYEPSIPLEARIVEKAEKDGLEREKIVFRGVQGFLVPAYLQLPRQPAGPCGCV